MSEGCDYKQNKKGCPETKLTWGMELDSKLVGKWFILQYAWFYTIIQYQIIAYHIVNYTRLHYMISYYIVLYHIHRYIYILYIYICTCVYIYI